MTSFRSNNQGSQYYETFSTFVRNQEALARRESNLNGIYVAHLTY